MELAQKLQMPGKAKLLNKPFKESLGQFLHTVSGEECQVQAMLRCNNELWCDKGQELRSLLGIPLLDDCFVDVSRDQTPACGATDSLIVHSRA
jgi:hypothetical protein